MARRWVRRVRAAVVVVVLLVAALLVVVKGAMWVTRWRMERLLADFHSIYPRQSTWADAQRLMTRWGRWGHYEGSCSPEYCNYVVQLYDPLSAEFSSGGWRWRDRYLIWPALR